MGGGEGDRENRATAGELSHERVLIIRRLSGSVFARILYKTRNRSSNGWEEGELFMEAEQRR